MHTRYATPDWSWQAGALLRAPLVFGLIYLVPARGAEPQFGIAVTGQETIRLAAQPHNARVYDLAFSPKPDSCVCAFAMEQVVQIWDLSAKPRVITTREVDQPLPKNLPREEARKFMAQVPHPVSFSRDGSRLAMANDPYGVRVWDLATRRSSVVARPFWVPEVIRFTASGDGLIVGCSWRGAFDIDGPFPSKLVMLPKTELEGMLVKDHSNIGQDRRRFGWPRSGIGPPEERDVYCLAAYPDGKLFAAGGGPVFEEIIRDEGANLSVTVWDIAAGRRVFEIGSKANPIRRFCLSPNGRVLYSCGEKILGWDSMKPGRPIKGFEGQGSRMISIAISPDGRMLAAGDLHGTVVIWNIEAAKHLRTLTHRAGPVYGLAFSPQSTKLVAAGERGVATVWSIEIHPAKKE